MAKKKRKFNHSDIYKSNKAVKVGTNCKCASCGESFVKNNYQQVFCKSKPRTQCKDAYWNRIDPSKRNNTTRISPASARWSEEKESRREENYNPDDFEHPFSSYALGQD